MAILLLITINATLTTAQAGEDKQKVAVGSRFLAAQVSGNNWGRRRKCDKFPTVCYLRGSPGPHCCNRKCVDVSKDRVNCGKCGKRCGYSEICCSGKCVNPSFNRSNCGGCGNKCEAHVGHYRKRAFCAFGLCNYA
ncbi:Stigma-specific STIG1-like protein 3 [Linum perenne]